MYKNIITIIFVQLLCSCGSRKNSEDPKQLLIDSLKWDIYAANFESTALDNYDPEITFTPVQCELEIRRIDSSAIDTIEYYIYPYQDTNKYWFATKGLVAVAGIRVSSTGNKYPIGDHWRFMFENEDSCKSFFKKNDLVFTKYLQEYKGDMSPWLRKEAIRRGVLKE
jgi:hypothetical protein